MAESPVSSPQEPQRFSWSRLRALISEWGGVIGLALLAASFISWGIGVIPWIVALPLAGAFGMLALLGIVGHVFTSNAESVQSLGRLYNDVTIISERVIRLKPPQEMMQPSAAELSEAKRRSVSLEELEENYEPLKKLEPNFVDFGNEYVAAYNDEKGVIIQGSLPDRESFHVLAGTFGNEHSRKKVRSLQRVSFRLHFIRFDRATRRKSGTVNIHRSAWLNEAEVEIDFPAHCPPRRAILVTVEGAENRVSAVRRDSDSSYKGILPLREELTGNIYTVFVSLLVDSRNSKSFQYILEIIRKPGFELRLNDAASWKSRHLVKFMDEGIAFSRRLHEIWKDANSQVPMDETSQPSIAEMLYKGSDAPGRITYFDSLARIRAIEREQEEKILDEIKDWESRATDWVDLFIGAGQRDNFTNSVPSIDVGFNRTNKSAFLRRFRVSLQSGEKKESPRGLDYWTLADAVNARVDTLAEIIKQL